MAKHIEPLPQELQDRIRRVWGDPIAVAEAATFGLSDDDRTPLVDQDSDTQVEFAHKIGVLAGQHSADATPDAFLAEFERTIWPTALELENPLETHAARVARICAVS